MIQRMQGCLNQTKLIANTLDLSTQVFLRDCVAEQDYVQLKDFVYNMTKSLHSNVDFIL